MIWDTGVVVVGLASIAAFVAAFNVSGLGARARSSISVASHAMAVIAEKAVDDDQKERIIQQAAVRLFGQFSVITLIAILVLAVPGAVMWAGDLIGLAPFAAVSDFLLSWEVITGATVVILGTAWLVRRR